MRYKIHVLTLQGRVLVFSVSEYKESGNFIEFKDEVTGDNKKFAASRCEIQEVKEWK